MSLYIYILIYKTWLLLIINQEKKLRRLTHTHTHKKKKEDYLQ